MNKTNRKNFIGLLNINYDEGDQDSYRHTTLTITETRNTQTVVLTYSSKPKDAAADYNRALRHGIALKLAYLGGKSSVDHFTMDGDQYEWEDSEINGGQKWETHSGDTENQSQTIEDNKSTNCSPVLKVENPSSNTLTMDGNTPGKSERNSSKENGQANFTSSLKNISGIVNEPEKVMNVGKPTTPKNSIRIKAFRLPHGLQRYAETSSIESRSPLL